MCVNAEGKKCPHGSSRSRFLRLAGVGAGALIASSLLPSLATAAALPPPPKPQNAIAPDEAMARLLAGNARYVQGVAKRQDFIAERETLLNGQNPFAAVLGCADSRIAPEYAFDTGRGDLFTVRVAGNFMTPDGLASLEYAVAVLGTPLVFALGHDGCGAVAAGMSAVQDNASFPGQIQRLAEAVKPAVEAVVNASGDLLENAIAQNVRDTVASLKKDSPLLAEALAAGRLKVVGGVYKMRTGEVQVIV